MEVRFRPLPHSALARRVHAGQTGSETGQSFMEVIESVTGAENNPEENPNSGRKQEPPRPRTSLAGGSEPVEESTETGSEEPMASTAEKIADKATPEGKPLGVRIDMTA
jgi:hypothetical protein